MRKSYLAILGLYLPVLIYSSVQLNTARIAYYQEQDFQRAKEACLEGIEAGQNNFELYALLGGCEIGLGNWQRASDALISAFTIDSSKTIDWLYNKGGGEQYFYQGFYFSARELFDEAKYDESLGNLRYAQLIDPTDISTYILRGAILYKLGKWEEANNEYKKVLNRDLENPDIHFLIGRSLFDSKNFERSLIYFKGAVKYYNIEHNRILLVLFQNLPGFDKVIAHKIMRLWTEQNMNELDKLIKEDLGHDGGIDAHQGNIDQYYTISDNLSRSYYYIGMAHYYLKQDSLALDNLLTSLDFNPDHLDGLFFTGEILIKKGKYPDAIEYLARLAELKEDDLFAWFYLGVCYTQLKEYEKAIEMYEKKVLALDPENIDVMTNLVVVYSKIGNKEKSLEYATRIEELKNK